MSMFEELAAFLSSLGIVVTTGVAAAIAFYATCWAGFAGGAGLSTLWAKGYDSIGYGLIAGVLLGTVAAGFVVYLLARRMWPWRE